MRVKVDSVLSAPRPVPGGSPQGSILGNFLFCCTTDEFGRAGIDAGPPITNEALGDDSTVSFGRNGVQGSDFSSGNDSVALPSPIQRPSVPLPSDSDDSAEEFRFFRQRRNPLDDTPDLSFRATQSEIDLALGVPDN